jgi:hypothetical protein
VLHAVHRTGRLVPVLEDCYVTERVPLNAVYPQGRHRMLKVRAFIDFLVERFSRAPWRVHVTKRAGDAVKTGRKTASGRPRG